MGAIVGTKVVVLCPPRDMIVLTNLCFIKDLLEELHLCLFAIGPEMLAEVRPEEEPCLGGQNLDPQALQPGGGGGHGGGKEGEVGGEVGGVQPGVVLK